MTDRPDSSTYKPRAVHRQKWVMLKGEAVQVDEGIARLVEALSRAGYDTVSSCEDISAAYVGIESPVAMPTVGFATRAEAERFSRLVDGARLIVPSEDDLSTDVYDFPPGGAGVCFLNIAQARASVEAGVKVARRD